MVKSELNQSSNMFSFDYSSCFRCGLAMQVYLFLFLFLEKYVLTYSAVMTTFPPGFKVIKVYIINQYSFVNFGKGLKYSEVSYIHYWAISDRVVFHTSFLSFFFFSLNLLDGLQRNSSTL